MVGSGVSDFAIPLVAVITLNATPGQMGVLRAVGAAPGIFLVLSAGVWVDRVSRQRLLITSELIAAALVVSVPIAYARGPLSFEHLVIVALCSVSSARSVGPRGTHSYLLWSNPVFCSTRTASWHSRER